MFSTAAIALVLQPAVVSTNFAFAVAVAPGRAGAPPPRGAPAQGGGRQHGQFAAAGAKEAIVLWLIALL